MANYDQTDSLLTDRKIPTFTLFKRIFKYAKKEWLRFAIALFLIVLHILINLIYPLIIEQMVNRLSVGTATLRFIIGLTVGYFVIYIFGQAMVYLESMILQKAGQRIIYTLRMEVFDHIENLSLNQLNMMPVGSLVTRVANYTTAMSDLFATVFVNILANIVQIVAVFVILMVKSWKLTLVLTIFIAVVFAFSFIFRKIITKLFRKERKQISEMNAFLNENLSGMKITQIFNQEERKFKEFKVKNDEMRRTRYKIILAFGLYRPSISFIYYVSLAMTFFMGMKLNISAGEVLAFYFYLSYFFNPVQTLADQLNNIQKATTASEKLFNLLDIESEVLDIETAKEIDHFNGKIEFKNVWFAYKEGEWVLKDVSFTIEAGQTAAFVGATGAGKTTILSLIVRNYEIQSGEILIDGINIKDVKIESLRRAVGQMLQDVVLFTGTIRDNITLHDENYDDEEIMEVCRYVNADTIFKNSSKGLDEELIEKGANLSQGQRQLLSFARTVLSKPQILILDEATANIDTETEVLIQQSLENMRNIGTMLVVAHRLSTIQSADQIIVLNKGEVVEKGNHQQLLRKHGYYFNLYKLQFEENN